MKIIAIGDPHIKSDNIVEFNLFENKLLELLESEKPDFVVILGDVLHHHETLYTPSLNRAVYFINKVSQNFLTYVLVGNHDMINNQQFLTDNHWMNSLKFTNKNIIIVDNVSEYKLKDKNFLFCPYVYPGRFEEALTTKTTEYKKFDMIFCHQEFKGCKMGAIVSEHGDEWKEDYPLIVSGHVHLNQWVGKNVYYPGSAMQHAFGESEKNIIPVINILDKIDIKEKDLGLPRKKIITMDIDKLERFKLDKEKKDSIKINISGNIQEFKNFKKTEKYKKLVEDGIKVVFKQKEIKKDFSKDDYKTTDKNEDKDTISFDLILRDMITKMRDGSLYKLYEKIVNKHDNDEIIIL